jgi:flagellar motility protein MotE (MotC chaperone)
MNADTTIYFSRILGRKVEEESGGPLGRLRDLVVDVAGQRPKVVAALVASAGAERLIDFASCRPVRRASTFRVLARSPREATLPAENLLYLKRHLLGKQIVDVDGRKLVRVNDLVLDCSSRICYLVAVDVGAEGRLRILGVDGIAKALAAVFRRKIPSKLILWNEVEAVDFSTTQIKLSKTYSKLDGIHPSDLADILEELDHASRVALFTSLDEERAADVLEELEPDAQAAIIENIPEEKAADVLEKMPADEAADVLDEVEPKKAERLLAEMEDSTSSEVRSLMSYPEHTVGSLMSTDYVFFNQSMKAGDAIAELRSVKPEADVVYSLFILDMRGRYVATVSLRDVVVADPETRLGEIMNSVTEPLRDTDDASSLPELMIKYKLHAVPVVDSENRLVGAIVIEDVLERVLRRR